MGLYKISCAFPGTASLASKKRNGMADQLAALEKIRLANGGTVTFAPADPYCGRVQSGHESRSIGDNSCP
jgi:hypothetical protein